MRPSTILLGAAATVSAATLPAHLVKKQLLGDLLDLEWIDADRYDSLNVGPVPAPTTMEEWTSKFSAPEEDESAEFSTLAAEEGGMSAMVTCDRAPTVRVEWRRMTQQARRNFLAGVNCLRQAPSRGAFAGSRNLYEDLVLLHLEKANQGEIHQNDKFLPWHRYYLHVFHTLLKNQCGYQGPLPWWDETLDAGNFQNSPLFNSANGNFGSLQPAQNGQIRCVTNGAFANMQVPLGSNTRDCLRRELNNEVSGAISNDWVRMCAQRGSYTGEQGHRLCNENGMHSSGHWGVGGVMRNAAASPGDPVFFLHHGFVDRMWKIWQNNHPASLTGIQGTGPNGQPLTPQTMLDSRGLVPAQPVARMLDAGGQFLCYKYD